MKGNCQRKSKRQEVRCQVLGAISFWNNKSNSPGKKQNWSWSDKYSKKRVWKSCKDIGAVWTCEHQYRWI